MPNVLRPDVARELSVIPGSVRSTGLPAKGAPSVYSCEYYGSDCRIYDGVTHKQLAQLGASDGLNDPQGNRTDSSGNWYIANTGAANVLEYSGDGSKLEATLDDAGWYPSNVAVHGSLVAVSNLTTISSTPGVVNFYSGGATEPSYALSDPLAMEGDRRRIRLQGQLLLELQQRERRGSGRRVPRLYRELDRDEPQHRHRLR